MDCIGVGVRRIGGSSNGSAFGIFKPIAAATVAAAATAETVPEVVVEIGSGIRFRSG